MTKHRKRVGLMLSAKNIEPQPAVENRRQTKSRSRLPLFKI